ncbi:MAG: hypothetical protein CSA60_04340 [Neptuniibacter caesariensis]|uniref:CHASE2 domain-containing protein n=1 Tax=Neptuniibacter caesariensis TaxID=207954 RepID=A0A2G6JK18_NEPCE|nr:MAG: hypothetical protein CSA60_04340 [Neptuniibacter caesariensis]
MSRLGGALVSVVLLVVVFAAGSSTYISNFDRWGYDRLVSYFPPVFSGQNQIVIIDIDRDVVARNGGWPLPRYLHKNAIDKLTESGASSVAYNIAFTQSDAVLSQDDKQLLQAIENNGRVVLPLIAERGREIYPFSRANISGAFLAHADLSADSDGVLRRCFLWAGMQYPRWPSLSLASLQSYAPVKADDHAGLRTPYRHIAFSNLWSRDFEVWLPIGIASFLQTVPRYSFNQLISGQIEAEKLRNKVVFVGIADERIEKRLALSGGQTLFSTEVQAGVFAGLNGGFALSPSLPFGAIVTGIIATLSCAVLLLFRSSRKTKLVSFLVLLGGLCAPLALIKQGYWVSYFPTIVGCFAVVIIFCVWQIALKRKAPLAKS